MGNEVVAAKPKPTKMAPRRGKAGRGPKPKMTKEERRTKYTDIAKKRRQKLNGRGGGGSGKTFVCYNCRLPGHNAADCPSLGGGGTEIDGAAICPPVTSGGTVLCYKCGSTEHPLKFCPKRHRGDRSVLPYATCFVCNEKGHLASGCPKNTTGIYVNGGSCRTCGSQQHLGKDCPEKKKKRRKDNDGETKKEDEEQKALLDDLLQVEVDPSSTVSKTKLESKDKLKKKSASNEPKKKRRVVKF